MSALKSGKFDEYKYFTGEEILPSDQNKIIDELSLHGLLSVKH